MPHYRVACYRPLCGLIGGYLLVCVYMWVLFMGLFMHLAAPHYALIIPPTTASQQNKRL